MSQGSIDVEGLAIGCLYLLAGQAIVSYPTSTRSHPSWEVVVELVSQNRLYRDGDRKVFPFQVTWDLWEAGITPVLKDGDLRRKVGRLRGSLYGGTYQALKEEVERALRASLVAASFIPPDSVEVPSIEEEPTGFGEPSKRVPVEIPAYRTYDE